MFYAPVMLTPEILRNAFDAGKPYDAYVATGTPDQQANWARMHGRVRLTPAQTELVKSFTRNMPVLVISGTWCGDCVQQCPHFDHIARANPVVHLRFVDRDQQKALSDAVKICGGNRVPTVLFMNEDFEFVGIAGDKCLTRLRYAAATQLGAACPVPGADLPEDQVAGTLADWLGEFERIHLTLRLSAKLRQRHGD